MRTDQFAEQLQLVYDKYKECHDLNVAMLLCGILDADLQAEIRADSFLRVRMSLVDAEYKATLHNRIDRLAISADKDSVRFSAIKMLAIAHYPERYKEKLELAGEIDYVVKRRKADAPVKKVQKKAPVKKGKKK